MTAGAFLPIVTLTYPPLVKSGDFNVVIADLNADNLPEFLYSDPNGDIK